MILVLPFEVLPRFFDNLVMKEGKRRRRWPCDHLASMRFLMVLRSYAGTLIFNTRKPIVLDGFRSV